MVSNFLPSFGSRPSRCHKSLHSAGGDELSAEAGRTRWRVVCRPAAAPGDRKTPKDPRESCEFHANWNLNVWATWCNLGKGKGALQHSSAHSRHASGGKCSLIQNSPYRNMRSRESKQRKKTNASVSGQREPVCGYHKKQGRVGAKCGWYFMAPHLWWIYGQHSAQPCHQSFAGRMRSWRQQLGLWWRLKRHSPQSGLWETATGLQRIVSQKLQLWTRSSPSSMLQPMQPSIRHCFWQIGPWLLIWMRPGHHSLQKLQPPWRSSHSLAHQPAASASSCGDLSLQQCGTYLNKKWIYK